jgi:deazaflavin-dependent oxidoreductase (nitroreductase family)
MPDEIGEELAAWGRILILETRGRVTGNLARAAVGFVERPDGSLVVAAGDPDADWVRNLLATPDCAVETSGRRFDARARELEGADHAAAIRDLILRYGTPAERLGAGPAFVLVPTAGGSDEGRRPD